MLYIWTYVFLFDYFFFLNDSYHCNYSRTIFFQFPYFSIFFLFTYLGRSLHLLRKKLYNSQYHQSYFKYLGIIQGFCKSFPTWGLLLINSWNVISTQFLTNFGKTCDKKKLNMCLWICDVQNDLKIFLSTFIPLQNMLWNGFFQCLTLSGMTLESKKNAHL